MTQNRDPWLDPNSIWKTKGEYFVWLRGALRRLWSDYPLRKQWKNKALRPVTAEERKQKVFHPSTKNVGQCVFCKEWFPGSKLEVDHKLPSSCYDYETAEQFLWHCGGATSDALQLSCKPDHKIKSHQERYGFETFEDAKRDKQAIAFVKQPKQAQETFFKQRGMDVPSNEKKRRQAYIDVLREESQ